MVEITVFFLLIPSICFVIYLKHLQFLPTFSFFHQQPLTCHSSPVCELLLHHAKGDIGLAISVNFKSSTNFTRCASEANKLFDKCWNTLFNNDKRVGWPYGKKHPLYFFVEEKPRSSLLPRFRQIIDNCHIVTG